MGGQIGGQMGERDGALGDMMGAGGMNVSPNNMQGGRIPGGMPMQGGGNPMPGMQGGGMGAGNVGGMGMGMGGGPGGGGLGDMNMGGWGPCPSAMASAMASGSASGSGSTATVMATATASSTVTFQGVALGHARVRLGRTRAFRTTEANSHVSSSPVSIRGGIHAP